MHEAQLELPFPEDWRIWSKTCGFVVPFFVMGLMEHADKHPPCLLHEDHAGGHLILRPDIGQFFLWEYELSLEDDEDDESVLWSDIPLAEAVRLLADSPAIVQNSLTF